MDKKEIAAQELRSCWDRFLAQYNYCDSLGLVVYLSNPMPFGGSSLHAIPTRLAISETKRY